MMPPEEGPLMDQRRCSLSRRQFVMGMGVSGAVLLAGCGRWPWQAAPAPKVARIGVLSQSADPGDANNAAFRQGLRDLGYSEGQNLTTEWRDLDNRIEQYPALAADLVGRSVDLIVAQGSAATLAAKQVSVTIPIVMAYSSDPVEAGLVASLARPGENVTGLAALTGQLAGKRLELLRDAVPSLAQVAMLWSPESAERAHEFEETAVAAQALGLGLQSVEVRHGGDLESAFAGILQGRAEALFLQTNPVTNRYRSEIVAFSTEHRLPAMSSRREFVVAGSLMSYGPDFPGMNRRAAYYVDRILKGAKPADLPVEQPMTFDFVVNMKTAQALGITFPNEIMLQVTEVLQ
jgi:putative tryptophan/tyrosine transport system substrate-binding protein